MSRITTLIADDEPIAREGLRRMLGEHDWLTVVGESANGPATVAAIDELRPELVFLDIQMPGFLGTTVLDRIAHHPFVVFTTAFAQHAVTAFELGALDYLLKPFGSQRLGVALERIRAAVGEPAATPAMGRLREALRAGPMSRLFVRTGATVVPVAVTEVHWFEARGDYVAAHTATARHLLHLSLNHLEARLDPARFLRIHRAHIVNLDQVAKFHRIDRSGLTAELKNGTRLAVSRARAQDLRHLST